MLTAALFTMVLMSTPEYRTLTITHDTTLRPIDVLHTRIIIKASHITLDGQDLELVGPGVAGNLESFEKAGPAILVEGCTNVTIKNVRARGFESGLVMRDCKAPVVERCDFSSNYTNPDFGWGELPSRGGIILSNVSLGVFRKNKANRVWDALSLKECNDNLFLDNDFSVTTNTCAKLDRSSRNKFFTNDLSYGIRIDRQKGEVHARDSTSVLIESGSNDNYFYQNTIRHGGDGLFIRPLNKWVSRGNVFVENDTSYANNNCIESWSPGNTYIRNIANHGSYGFWLGGSDETTLIGNIACYNGLAEGYHNAPEPVFGHGGIVIVGASSSHTLIEGNRSEHNNGGGIVYRGAKDGNWRTEHWVVQQNQLADNKFPVWGKFGDWITVGGNTPKTVDITDSTQVKVTEPIALRAPIARFVGPKRATQGQEVVFDASGSKSYEGDLTYEWVISGKSYTGSQVRVKFEKPGFVRVGLNVTAGGLTDIAYQNVLVVDKSVEEIGTEGSAALWKGDNGYVFVDDDQAIVGATSLRMTPSKYEGNYATATLTGSWNWTGKTKLVFWLKFQNPNVGAFQNAGPVITLRSEAGSLTLQPAKDNLFENLPYSEARETWMRVEIPLAGDTKWSMKSEGKPDLKHLKSLSFALDSWGIDPFNIWLDGMHVE